MRNGHYVTQVHSLLCVSEHYYTPTNCVCGGVNCFHVSPYVHLSVYYDLVLTGGVSNEYCLLTFLVNIFSEYRMFQDKLMV